MASPRRRAESGIRLRRCGSKIAPALEAALAGAGVAITDARYVDGLIARGRLVALGPPPLAEGYYFVRRRQVRNPRHVDCLGTWLQEQAASC